MESSLRRSPPCKLNLGGNPADAHRYVPAEGKVTVVAIAGGCPVIGRIPPLPGDGIVGSRAGMVI